MDLAFFASDGALSWAQAFLDETQREALARFLGRLHPLAVHMPVGLILTAGVFEFFAMVRRRERSPVALNCLWFGALAAIVAAVFGWLSAAVDPPGSSVERTLFLHRWTGVAIAVAAPLAALLAMGARRSVRAQAGCRVLLLIAVGLVMFGGHLGGELVHGEDYVREPLRAVVDAFTGRAATEVAMTDDDTSVARVTTDVVPNDEDATLTGAVQAIFDTRCLHCHGPKRRKARLRLDGLATARVDHSVFNVLSMDDPATSELLYRIMLDDDDPDLMPADEGVLTAEEIATIERWVNAGGPTTMGALPDEASAPETSVPEPSAESPTGPQTEPPASAGLGRVDGFGLHLALADDPRRSAALARLSERGAIALPVAEDAAAVDVSFALADPPATDADLDLLAGLEPTLVWLNLAGSVVTDEGLARLASFTHLRRLRLERTNVGDDGIDHLARHTQLRFLNVYGTRLTDAGLRRLAELPALERVYVWQTPVTPEGVAAALAIAPELKIERGDDAGPAIADPEPTEEAAVARPACCVAAEAAGGECDHACCVAARERGEVCARCSAGP